MVHRRNSQQLIARRRRLIRRRTDPKGRHRVPLPAPRVVVLKSQLTSNSTVLRNTRLINTRAAGLIKPIHRAMVRSRFPSASAMKRRIRDKPFKFRPIKCISRPTSHTNANLSPSRWRAVPRTCPSRSRRGEERGRDARSSVEADNRPDLVRCIRHGHFLSSCDVNL